MGCFHIIFLLEPYSFSLLHDYISTCYSFGLFHQFAKTAVVYIVYLQHSVCIHLQHSVLLISCLCLKNIYFTAWSCQSVFDFRLLLCITLFGNIYLLWWKSKMVRDEICWGGSKQFDFGRDLILLKLCSVNIGQSKLYQGY